MIPQHICSCFSSSYVWFSSQIYNNLLTISDFPPSSSVLMNLFTLMERKQFHLSCAISLVYSTSPVKVRALQVFHFVSLFSSSSSYLWLSSRVYNNLLTTSDFRPSSSVLMNLFTLMECNELHLLCAISHVYSTSPVKVHALQVFHVVSLFSSPSVICFFFSFPSFCFPCPSWFPWSWSYTLSCFVDLASSMAESSQFTTCLVTET